MPKHDLADIRAAATRAGGLILGRKAGYDRLMGVLNPREGVLFTEQDCRSFAKDVLIGLTPNDYAHSRPIPNTSNCPSTHGTLEDYDVYGVQLDAKMLAKYGLTNETTWYVKLTFRQQGNSAVYCMSLHRLEHPLCRVGGTLCPAW